jgi:hypothetical protein
MSIAKKKTSKRAIRKSPKGKYPRGFVVPESQIRDLAINLRVGEAQDVGMCLLVIGEAARAIAQDKTQSDKLNLRLIKQVASEEGCKPARRIIEAIIAALDHGAEGIYAASLTISRFLEFAFGFAPDPRVAQRLYKARLSKIGQAAKRSK